ncbi:hypothetical protein C8R46DRAFT_918056 [Mycena filopes]|nr:hypothetical protein C8R46DRAFT_918056 [Mycena filopes]
MPESRNDSEPTAKRKRTAEPEDLTRSDIWHDDGSVVLQAETTLFRAHWSVLCLHSSFFRDLRGLPQPADQPSIEGCPVIQVYDSSADVKHLLDALYNPLLFSKSSLPLAFIAAIIRLGRKYELKDLLAAAVQRLTLENPTTLGQYEHLVGEHRTVYVSKHIDMEGWNIFETIALARENNLLAVLPCAFLRAVFFYENTLLVGIPKTEGGHVTLSTLDQQTCLDGLKKMLKAQWKHEPFWAWFSLESRPPGCTNAGCMPFRSRLFRLLVEDGISLVPFASIPATSLCGVCLARQAAIMVETRQTLWNELPTFFGLPPWTELKNDI